MLPFDDFVLLTLVDRYFEASNEIKDAESEKEDFWLTRDDISSTSQAFSQSVFLEAGVASSK